MSLTEDLAQAIAKYEGFYTTGSVADRNNNPGNLRSWGTYPVVNGYVHFPDAQSGWDALQSQVRKNIGRGLTLYQFFGGKAGVYAGYAPAADRNAPATYAQTVAGWLGISPSVTLSTATEPAADPQAAPAGVALSWPALTLPGLDTATAGTPDWMPYAAVAVAAVAMLALISFD